MIFRRSDLRAARHGKSCAEERFSPLRSFLRTLKGWRDLSGRSSRADCGVWLLLGLPAILVLLVLAQSIHEQAAELTGLAPERVLGSMALLIVAPAAVMTVSLTVRRLIDIGLPSWLILPRIGAPVLAANLAGGAAFDIGVAACAFAFDLVLLLAPSREAASANGAPDQA